MTDDGMISIWVCFICVICLSSLLSRLCVVLRPVVYLATVGFGGGGGGGGGGGAE